MWVRLCGTNGNVVRLRRTTAPAAPSQVVDQDAGRRKIRKTRLRVNISLKAKAPESLDSGAAGGNIEDRLTTFRMFGDAGSPQLSLPRSRTAIDFPIILTTSATDATALLRATTPPSADLLSPPPGPIETPLQRAIRLQAMLESGQVPNRAALARLLGVSRAAVTKALKYLPV